MNVANSNTQTADVEFSVDYANAFKVDADQRLAVPPKIAAFLDAPDDAEAFKAWLTLCDVQQTHLSAKDLITVQIAEIDELVCEQINAILHNERFQRLEARWLGLWHLVDESAHSKNIKIKVLDISWRELCRDTERASDFENTRLFNLVYNQEFGTAGGEPYSVLIGDYEVTHRPTKRSPHDDVHTLQVVSQVAAAAFAPFICAASPELFGVDRYDEIHPHINFEEVFSHPEYIRWNSLREQEDSRFLAITLPSVLMRHPINQRFSAYGSFRFQEYCQSHNSDLYLWGNSAFAFVTVLIREFSEVGWFSHIRGVPRDHKGGGLLTSFVAPPYSVDSTPSRHLSVTPCILTDSMERQLTDLGLITLSQGYGSIFAAFTNCPSLQKPHNYGNKSANANARISSMMQHILCASRFAQYVKIIIREKIGSFTSAEDCQRKLQKWFDKYTSGRDDLGWDMLARRPLRRARVHIIETPGQLEAYQCVIYLKNHYTVDHLVAELKLSTSISKQAVGNINE